MEEQGDVEMKTVMDSVWRRLGYSHLRREQEEAVTAFVGGNDVFVALPTGSGKSLCFAILPWLFNELHPQREGNSILIVVSPLLALMKDEVSCF